MSDNPLRSLAGYSRLVAQLFDRATVKRSTVVVWSESPYTGIAEGEVFFSNGVRLRMREELDFDAGMITAYGYEVYRGSERLYWYDDFPHPNDPSFSHDISSSQTHSPGHQTSSCHRVRNKFHSTQLACTDSGD